jgi:hypothetical protein
MRTKSTSNRTLNDVYVDRSKKKLRILRAIVISLKQNSELPKGDGMRQTGVEDDEDPPI